MRKGAKGTAVLREAMQAECLALEGEKSSLRSNSFYSQPMSACRAAFVDQVVLSTGHRRLGAALLKGLDRR